MQAITLSQRDFQSLLNRGAISLPVLDALELKEINHEAKKLLYKKRGSPLPNGFVQDFWETEGFGGDDVFGKLAKTTAAAITRALAPYLRFEHSLVFNDLTLWRYFKSRPEDQFAVSPHIDYERTIKVVGVYILRRKSTILHVQ